MVVKPVKIHFAVNLYLPDQPDKGIIRFSVVGLGGTDKAAVKDAQRQIKIVRANLVYDMAPKDL